MSTTSVNLILDVKDPKTGEIIGQTELTGDLTMNFTPIVVPEPEPVVGLDIELYNAQTDTLIQKMVTGGVVAGSVVSDGTATISVTTVPGGPLDGVVGSVRIDIDGQIARLENVAPYALFGDTNGDLAGGLTLLSGEHTLTVQAFSESGGNGVVLEEHVIEFTVSPVVGDGGGTSAGPIPVSGYDLVWADEFNTGWSPAPEWNTLFAQWGGLRTLIGNQEKQLYVDPGYKNLGLNPFSINNNNLVITANKTPSNLVSQLNGYQYYSGVLTTKRTWIYGYFEMRAKLPAGKGLWPAFWLIGDGNYGHVELDVFEVLGHQPGRIYQTSHSPDNHTDYIPGWSTADGFHTYGIEWVPGRVRWFVDGIKTKDIAWSFDRPMYMLQNVAVGGSWPGDPDSSTPFPARMEVEYVRAYQK